MRRLAVLVIVLLALTGGQAAARPDPLASGRPAGAPAADPRPVEASDQAAGAGGSTTRNRPLELGAQHVIAMLGDNGELQIETSRGFSAHAELFWTEAFSTRASATFVNPATILYPDNPPPSDVDLGTLGLDLYAATARWHFAPRSRLSVFAGAGGALVTIGNLDDQFGEDVEIEFDPQLAAVAEAGLRYRFRSRIFVEAGVTYLPLEVEGDVKRARDSRYQLPRTLAVDPLIVSVGAAWRF